MNMNQLDAVPSQRIVETALVVLSEPFEIDDPSEGIERLMTITESELDPVEIEGQLRAAAQDEMEDVAQLLRLVLAVQDDPLKVAKGVEVAGRKQLVVSPDLLYTGGLIVLCGFAMLRKPGKSEQRRVITIEESPNGKRKVTVDEHVKYFNPDSPMIRLLERFFGPDAK